MIPLTFIIGADLLLLSDVLSRLITYPYESPVGIVNIIRRCTLLLIYND